MDRATRKMASEVCRQRRKGHFYSTADIGVVGFVAQLEGTLVDLRRAEEERALARLLRASGLRRRPPRSSRGGFAAGGCRRSSERLGALP